MNPRISCSVCGGHDLVGLVTMNSVPALCNQRIFDPGMARAVTRATIELVGCRTCGHMFNRAFDPAKIDYSASYENSLLCSPRYRRYTDEVVDRIRSVCGNRCDSVVEIGCGRGEFLRILSEAGFRDATGFDPGRHDETIAHGRATISIIGTAFDAAVARDADLVCSRHVLEHLSDPVDLLLQVHRAYDQRPPRLVFVEVPNGSFTLEHLGIWDLIYEHVSYFTRWSLSRALAEAGLRASSVQPVFGGQFLIAEATLSQGPETACAPPAAVIDEFESFGQRFEAMLSAWRDWCAGEHRKERRIALWGGGSKGVMFLNLVDSLEEQAISFVVDSNPLKAGAFIAGTGHKIIAPGEVAQSCPDIVLLMNPEYEDEVRTVLATMQIEPEIVVVSGRMPPEPSPAIARGRFSHLSRSAVA